MANTVYDLVFEGGGAKGAVFIGALQELESRGYRPGSLVGTSAGAITATMLAAGYSAKQMADVTRERTPEGLPRFSTFLDPPTEFSDAVIQSSGAEDVLKQVSLVQLVSHIPHIPGGLSEFDDRFRLDLIRQVLHVPPARSMFSFVERGGLYEGSKFLAWVREKLDAARPGLANSTLAEFHQATGSDLSLVASDVTGSEMLVLNHLSAPACPTAWAVRMSMSIPLLWQEVDWDASWGAYQSRDISGHVIVDGGVLSNFPLQLLLSRPATTGGAAPASRVLGLLIDETLEVPGAGTPEANKAATVEQKLLTRIKTVQRVRRLIDCMTEAHDKQVITAHEDLVCRLPAKSYGTTEFDMNEARMEALMTAGRNAMIKYLGS